MLKEEPRRKFLGGLILTWVIFCVDWFLGIQNPVTKINLTSICKD